VSPIEIEIKNQYTYFWDKHHIHAFTKTLLETEDTALPSQK